MKPTPKTILYLAVIFGSLLIANGIHIIPVAFFKVILAWLAFLFIPGDCLYSLCLGQRADIGPGEKFAIVFCLGLGFISVLGLAAYFLHFSWWFLEIILLCCGLGLVVISRVVQGRHPDPLTPPLSPQGRGGTASLSWSCKTDRTAVIIFLAAVALVTILSFYLGGAVAFKPVSSYFAEVQKLPAVIVGHRTADRIVHWGAIKSLVEGREIYNQWSTLNYSYNIWHLFIALVSKFAGVSYRWVWSYSILFCVPLSLSAVFSLGKVLFNNERLALVCSFVHLVNTTLFNNYFSDAGLWNWIGSPNPREIGFILMTMISFFVLKYILRGEKRFFWLALFLGPVTLFIHDIDFLFVVISLFLFAVSFLLFHWQDKDGLKRIIKLLALLLLAGIPLILAKSPSAVALSNPLAVNPGLATPVISGGGEIMGVKAGQLGIPPTPIIFLSFLLIPFLFPRLREDKAVLFLVATTVLPPLIAYNPIIPSLISKSLAALNIKVPVEIIALVTGLRTACLFPAVYICAYGFYRGMGFICSRVGCAHLPPGGHSPPYLVSLALGIIVAWLAASQFIPLKFLPKINWPFYPPWAMFLLVITNFLLLISERIFYFPSRLLRRLKPAAATNPLIPTLIFSLAALTLAIPAELKFFTSPARFQTINQLAEGTAGFKFLSENIPQEALVLSDPITSFYLPAYSGHNPTGFAALQARKKGQASPLDALNPNLSAKMRLAMLKKDRIEYLYLDWRIIHKKLKTELAALPQHYRLIYQDKNTGIYEVGY